MKRSHRLKTIVDLKAAQEQKSLEAVGIAQHKLADMQAQVDNLKLYRQGYQDKFNLLGNAGANVGQLLEYRSFMDKLDKAIAGQEHALDRSKTELAMKKKTWEKLHHHTLSLEKIYQGALKTEANQESKREQSELDERSSRLSRNNSAT